MRRCCLGLRVCVLGGLLIIVPNHAVPEENFCKVSTIQSDALHFPSRHAWNLFMLLQHPARSEGFVRGEPNCSVPLGAPGETSVWETWRLASHEVFLPDGSEPPEWNDRSLSSGEIGSTPRSQRDLRPFLRFDPDEGVFHGRGGLGETRMNRSTYEFIKDNCLWSREGLLRYEEAALAGTKPPINFPADSIEVKAVWLELTNESDHDRYYVAQHNGRIHGLTSFHILTKDIPKWFWATFHHKDAPENEFELEDTYGPPPLIEGTVWENYVLGGTQVDFVDEIGKPVILSDHYIEFGFTKSSCITCHSQASSNLRRDPDDPSSERRYPDGPTQTIDVGTPDAKAYFDDEGMTRLRVIPTDFLWSIPFRVKPEVSPPPVRCSWPTTAGDSK